MCALGATASTSSVSFAQSLALFHLAQQQPMCTLSSQFAWTIAYPFTLACLLFALGLASLSRVLRSAARLIGQIPKFGHVSSYMLEVLHWLPIRQRIEYRSPPWCGDVNIIGPCSDLPNRPLSTCIEFS